MKKRLYAALFLVLLLLPFGAQAAKAPRQLRLMPGDAEMVIDQTLKLTAIPIPAGSSSLVRWNTSNRTIATVDRQGLITAHTVGKVKIRARSSVRSSVYTVRTITVTADPAQTNVTILPDSLSIAEGAQATLTAKTKPEKSGLTVLWKSSDEDVAQVNAVGRVWAVSPGTATVTAYIEGGQSDTVQVTVRGFTLSTEVPARATPLADLDENMEKIEAVHASALGSINRLLRKGNITAYDAQRRITMMNRAFEMYAFAWMTDKPQPYWTQAYGTVKDFRPGVVYYGLPYIQYGLTKNSINRTYDVGKAVRQGFYIDTGKGYHKLSPTKRRDGMYVGNDCSSFVGMSIWGPTSSNAWLRTGTLFTSSLYKTVRNYGELRTGDLLVKNNSHVVFFLYYVDAQKTRMMILEQGGGTATDIHNTLCCSIVNISKYQKNLYRPRRLKSLA